MDRNVSKQCPDVTWCTQTGLHERHQQLIGQWAGTTVTADPNRRVDLELQVYGPSEHDARPVITLIDSMRPAQQIDCEITITQLMQFALEGMAAAERFSGRMT